MKQALGMLALIVSASSWAAQPAPAASAPASAKTPAEALAELEAARALAKARFELAKQEAELANVKKAPAVDVSPPPGSPPPAPGRVAMAPRGAASAALLGPGGVNAGLAAAPLPVVVGLTGVGGQFTAEVSIGDARRTVKIGEYLPGGVLVSNIDASGVTLLRDGKVTKQKP